MCLVRIYGFNLDKDCCKRDSKIFNSLQKQGFTVGQFDCFIAGSFLENGVKKILTRNTKKWHK